MIELTLKDALEVLVKYDLSHIHLSDFTKDGRVFGICYTEEEFRYGRIIIDSSRRKDTQIRTLIHELTHAYLSINGLKDPENRVKEIEKYTYDKHFK